MFGPADVWLMPVLQLPVAIRSRFHNLISFAIAAPLFAMAARSGSPIAVIALSGRSPVASVNTESNSLVLFLTTCTPPHHEPRSARSIPSLLRLRVGNLSTARDAHTGSDVSEPRA